MERNSGLFDPTVKMGLALFAGLPVIPLSVWSACRVGAVLLTLAN